MTTEEAEVRFPEEKLEFSTVREDWSVYKLKDTGSLVKIKFSPSNLVDTGRRKGKMHALQFGTSNVFFKEPLPDDKGEPSESAKILEEDIIQDLQFEKVSEPVNVYDVPEKFIILIRPRLTNIRKTRKFDSNGNRIYNYSVQCAINIVKYPKVT